MIGLLTAACVVEEEAGGFGGKQVDLMTNLGNVGG